MYSGVYRGPNDPLLIMSSGKDEVENKASKRRLALSEEKLKAAFDLLDQDKDGFLVS